MTKDEIIEMAKQAGFEDHQAKFDTRFEPFAKLVAEKLECYERLADASEMASNPMGVKSRVALRNVREMKTIMTQDEEILRAVEAEQEPVAWWNDTGTHIDLNVSGRGTPLYTTPPQREWVGLTRTELIKCGVLPFGMSYELCQAIEAKLKDKNT